MKLRVIDAGNRRKAKRKIDRHMNSLDAAKTSWADLDSRTLIIQQLTALGLIAVQDCLEGEITRLAGARYSRGSGIYRWGSNSGSVYLGDQKVAISVPRLRNAAKNKEVNLEAYEKLQSPSVIDEALFKRIIHGISARKYSETVLDVPETFGISRSSVSRRFKRVCQGKLEDFMERDLNGHDIVAIFIDGKTFGENELIMAVGVTMKGEKIILGFIEASSENHAVCKDFINDLLKRGLKTVNPILFIVDGAKGLRKGIKLAVGDKAIIQRCQWHKRENIVDYLGKKHKANFRRKLQDAYSLPTEDQARKELNAIGLELRLLNESAYKSLKEGLDETLTALKLGLPAVLTDSLKTTNCIENVHSIIGIYTNRVDRWRTSNQRQRWAAASLQEIEPGLRKLRGHKHMQVLRESLIKMMKTQEKNRKAKAA